MHRKLDTFEVLVLKLSKCVTKGVNKVYVVADPYLDNSINAAERKTRRENRTVIIKSIKPKKPAGFQFFLKNDGNKTRIIDLLLDHIIKHKIKVFKILRCMKIYISKYNYCQFLSLSYVGNALYHSFEQEEADTRILHHFQHILNIQKEGNIVIRPPLCDTDIIIIGVSLLKSDHIFITKGLKKNKLLIETAKR